VPPILLSVLFLALLVAAAVVVIVTIRGRCREGGEDRGGWEKALVDYRNLRDAGVLSEEEYRKIRTLVEPHTRPGGPASAGRQPSAPDSAGPEPERN